MDAQQQHLEALVRRCGRSAWTVAWSLLRDRDEAHDAVQQAFLVAARKLDQLPHDDPWPWFAVVVAHEARNLRRKRRPLTNSLPETAAMSPREPAVTITDPSSAAEQRDDVRHLQRALDRLPADERDAIALTHLAGMTHALAAEALDVPRQTVSARVQRGLGELSRHLDRKPSAVSGALALVPIIPPTAGWDAALSVWSQAALAQTAVAAAGTSAAAAKTVLGGLSLMSSKTLLILSVSAAIGMGFLGGHLTTTYLLANHHPDGESGASKADVALAPQGADAPGTGSPSLDTPHAREGTMERLHRENAELRRSLAEATSAQRDLAARLTKHIAPTGPTFTFGALGSLPAIHEANWREMAQSSVVVSGGVHEILRKKEAGEAVPKEVYLRLQENVERMRKYEYRTVGKMPTAAKHNGEITHPITVTNLFAAILEEANVPLSPEQVKRIAALGLGFERDFASQRERHGADTPRVKRMLAEYRLKGRFTDDVVALLTGEQQAAVFDPETHGLAGLDMLSPTLMILHTSPLLTGTSVDEIAGKLRGILVKKLALPAEEAQRLEGSLDGWKTDVRDLLERVPATRLRHFTYAQGILAGEASVRLTTRLLAELKLSEEARHALLDDYAIYVPRIVAKAG